jgi:hypothetical protein
MKWWVDSDLLGGIRLSQSKKQDVIMGIYALLTNVER